jgi:hypothetical protein
MPNLLEITDFHQSRPKFDRSLDHPNRIIHNSQQIVLEEIRLKAIKRLLQIGRENLQRIYPLRTLRRLRPLERPAMQTRNLLQNLLCILRRYFARY